MNFDSFINGNTTPRAADALLEAFPDANIFPNSNGPMDGAASPRCDKFAPGCFNAPSAQSLDKGRNIAQAMARRPTHVGLTLSNREIRASQNPDGSCQSRQTIKARIQ